MRSSWRTILGFALVIVVAGGVAWAVFHVSRPETQLATSAPTTPVAQLNGHETGSDNIFLFGRSDFTICVDRVGVKDLSAGPADEQIVQTALDQALAALPTVPAAYQTPILVVGCPRPALLSGKPLTWRERNGLRDRSQIIGAPSGPAAASPYRVFVYFTEPSSYRAAFGAEPYATTVEEIICQGMCLAVTRAIYVPYDDIQIDRLKSALLEVLNLLDKQQVDDLLNQELYSTPTATAEATNSATEVTTPTPVGAAPSATLPANDQ